MADNAPHKLVLVSAVALINDDDQILLAQRPEGKSMAGLWEFPGGKIELNESPEDALVRELREELSIEVNKTHLTPLQFVSHHYPDFHLLMVLYACYEWVGVPTPLEGQSLNWVTAANLHSYDAPAADIPLFEFLASGRHREPNQ